MMNVIATLLSLAFGVGLVVLSRFPCPALPGLPPLAFGMGLLSMASMLFHLVLQRHLGTMEQKVAVSVIFGGLLLGASVATLVVAVPSWGRPPPGRCEPALLGVASLYATLVAVGALIGAGRWVLLLCRQAASSGGSNNGSGTAAAVVKEEPAARLLEGAHTVSFQ